MYRRQFLQLQAYFKVIICYYAAFGKPYKIIGTSFEILRISGRFHRILQISGQFVKFHEMKQTLATIRTIL